jgi:hypothetical protein
MSTMNWISRHFCAVEACNAPRLCCR